MALTKARNTQRLGAANEVVLSSLSLPQKGGTTIFDQSLVAISGGYVQPFVAGTGLVAAGKAAIPNGQPLVAVSDGDNNVRVEQGVFAFLMGSGANAFTTADIGKVGYGSDDQTFNKTDGGGLWSVAGIFLGLKSSTEGYLSVALQNVELTARRNCEEISASGVFNPAIRTTRYTVGATLANTLADGSFAGQRKTIYCVSVSGTPVGVVTPAHASGFTTITFGAASGKCSVELEWDSSLGTPAWKLVGVTTTAGATLTIA